MPHIEIILFADNSRSQLWGNAKVYPDDGIRYSMRIRKRGFTNHIPGPLSLPDFREWRAASSFAEKNGYGVFLRYEDGTAKELEVSEDWLDKMLDRILKDYTENMSR